MQQRRHTHTTDQGWTRAMPHLTIPGLLSKRHSSIQCQPSQLADGVPCKHPGLTLLLVRAADLS
jgi:hypothetical protein